MTKKDILELKHRLTKDGCTFTRLSVCYVDANKNKVLSKSDTFLTLDDEEFYKYLEIAKKILSGTVGNNILELPFSAEENGDISRRQFLLGIRDSVLKDEGLLDRLYELIIKNYQCEKNYLILLFHDAYDVITKTSDKEKLDESEEVFDYILCAVCPVELSKAALEYMADENRIAASERDWIVEMPQTGFVYPAFSDRSADVNFVMYYSKNPKDTHPEFMTEVLGCCEKRTAAEQKETFTQIVKDAAGENEEKGEHLYMKLQKELLLRADEHESVTDGKPLELTEDIVEDIMSDVAEEYNIPQDVRDKVVKSYSKEFSDVCPEAKTFIDQKAIEKNMQKEHTIELEGQVKTLKEKLNEKKAQTEEVAYGSISLSVPKEKEEMISSRIIDGKKYIVIPVEEGELAKINGIEKKL